MKDAIQTTIKNKLQGEQFKKSIEKKTNANKILKFSRKKSKAKSCPKPEKLLRSGKIKDV